MLIRVPPRKSESKWTQLLLDAGFELGFRCAMKASCLIFLACCLSKYELKRWIGPVQL